MLQLGVVVLFAAIGLLDLPRLLKERKKKVIAVHLMIFGTAFVISELHLYHFHIISPNRIITSLVRYFVG